MLADSGKGIDCVLTLNKPWISFKTFPQCNHFVSYAYAYLQASYRLISIAQLLIAHKRLLSRKKRDRVKIFPTRLPWKSEVGISRSSQVTSTIFPISLHLTFNFSSHFVSHVNAMFCHQAGSERTERWLTSLEKIYKWKCQRNKSSIPFIDFILFFLFKTSNQHNWTAQRGQRHLVCALLWRRNQNKVLGPFSVLRDLNDTWAG
jgi:hypothetical protein